MTLSVVPNLPAKSAGDSLKEARELARIAYAQLVYLFRNERLSDKDRNIALDAAVEIAEAMDLLDHYTLEDSGASRSKWLKDSQKARKEKT